MYSVSIHHTFCKKNLWTATGYAGTGLTFGNLAGHILADHILDRESPWAELYEIGRIGPMSSVGRFARENANVARYWVSDWLSRDDESVLSDMPLDSGRVVEGPFQKVAIYKDVKGQLLGLSPVCGHLGGIVHWNEVEKTWDCPCHGSRYTCKGSVMCGPSLRDLESIPLGPDILGNAQPIEIRESDLLGGVVEPPV